MKIHLRRVLSGAVLSLSSAGVLASPIVLDTEQKAAAGVHIALTKAETPRGVNGTIDSVREYAHHTLKLVNDATTPAALLGASGGITFDCAVSGSFRAWLADAQPRVLRVRFTECVTLVFGIERRLNGPVAITLPADTFQPQNVLAVRLGNDSGEFFEQIRFETQEQNDDITLAFNIVLRGDVSMTRLFDCCEWVGSSSFVMHGYFDNRTLTEAPPGSPAVFRSFKLVAQRLGVVRSTNTADGVDEDDTLYSGGSVSFEQVQPPPFGSFADLHRFGDFHVRRITDFNAFTDTLTVDGRLNVTWNPFVPEACMDGLYSFRTREPMVIALDTQAITSGTLGVNRSVVAKFYSAANVPPGLPTPVNGMLLNMRVRDVGTFNYDVANWFEALRPVGQCF